MHCGKVSVLFSETIGCAVDGDALAFRSFGEGILDQPIAEFDGWKQLSELGWDATPARSS